ncbi:hypothetical protein BU17DRAFT_84452 [Hysterangium stoloniferum]|nr:hypothetical protein BU17DRAFT_84452 [Hysterangium stoloniferum]
MPSLRIDGTETDFYYVDSGVPTLKDRPYTTLVMLHGRGFNSHIFHRLLPVAKSTHIRLVLVNRRGYAGSTPFDPRDAELFESSLSSLDDSGQSIPQSERSISRHYTTFLQHRGVEMARFLFKFIKQEKIPPISHEAGRPSGGISLLGWSFGNTITLSLLAFANTFDPGMMKTLERFLRKVIIYDATIHAIGYPSPDSYYPSWDAEIPPEERQLESWIWESSYFSYPQSLRDPNTPMCDLMSGVLAQRSPNPGKRATMSNIMSDDFAAGFEPATAENGDIFLLPHQARPVHRSVYMRALFRSLNEGNAPVLLPKVGISYVWGTESIWQCILAMKATEDDISSPPDCFHIPRRVKFFAIEGGNHFTHWDNPLKVLATFDEALA